MKTNAIIRIVLYSIVILLIVSILGGFLAFDRYSFRQEESSWAAPIITTGSGVHHEEHHIAPDTEPVTHIEIEWVAGTVTILPGDTDRIQFSESGKFDNDEAMVYRQDGRKLTIHYQKQDVYFGIYSVPEKDLTITVPRDWEGVSISLDTAFADLRMQDISVRELELDSASGGAVFENCTIEELDIDTASGDVNFTGTLDNMEYDAASADLHAVFHNVPRSLDMGTASGDMDITLPDGAGFTAEVDAMSGDFRSDFEYSQRDDRYISGDGSCRINLSAMSGDVHIRKDE